jgi:hypothetical protein
MRRYIRLLLALCLSGILLDCYGAGAQTIEFDDPFLDAHVDLVRQVARESELVFVGKVVLVGPAPSAWSGRMRARQAVAISVDRVLKGFAPEPTITIYEPVVADSRLAAIGRAPALSQTLFATGNNLIVFARRAMTPEMFDGPDENVGVVPSTAANVRAIRKVLW